MRVVVAYNAPSRQSADSVDDLAEHGVLTEVEDVTSALLSLGHDVEVLPLGLDLKAELESILSIEPDIVFNLVEGLFGKACYEAVFPAWLEANRIPFTGCSPTAIGMTLTKNMVYAVLSANGLPTPRSWPGRSASPEPGDFPLIVKPACEGGSVGIDHTSVVRDRGDLDAKIEAFGDTDLIVQRFIDGEEMTVGFVGDAQPHFFPVRHIDYRNMPAGHPHLLSYRAKWVPDSPEHAGTMPYTLPASQQRIDLREEAALAVSKRVFSIFGLSGYARVDFRCDDSGRPYVIDINANPDISRNAGLARSAEASGWTYEELIATILEIGMERYARGTALNRREAR